MGNRKQRKNDARAVWMVVPVRSHSTVYSRSRPNVDRPPAAAKSSCDIWLSPPCHQFSAWSCATVIVPPGCPETWAPFSTSQDRHADHRGNCPIPMPNVLCSTAVCAIHRPAHASFPPRELDSIRVMPFSLQMCLCCVCVL